mgnify:CR=1 FL=1
MFYDNKGKKEQNADSALLSGLTRRQLKELEEKEKTPVQKTAEAIIMILPLICGGIALCFRSTDPIVLLLYTLCVLFCIFRHRANISRLMHGQEKRFSLFGKSKAQNEK